MGYQESQIGRVYLVGAGPGDPGLITVRGRDLLCEADVVVYDHLVSQGCLDMASPHASRYYVGKKAGKHTVTQDEINALLANEARQGHKVVRLKGGDPFVFGRGGEECLYLSHQGIPFEVVPGISATAAVPAYAGIPLTHRDVSTHYVVVTGHEPASKEKPSVDWASLANIQGTLVIFMGVLQIRHITSELIKHGRSPDTPAAVIRWGTAPEQQTLVGSLKTIADQVEETGLRPPGMIVIGEVVKLRENIQWFEQKSQSNVVW